MSAPAVRLRPAEAVATGHPDKLADAIADRLVHLAALHHPRALVGVEVGVHRSLVFVTGRIAGTRIRPPVVDRLVRHVYRSVGHGATWGPRPEYLRIVTDLDLGPLLPGEDDFREVADDQAISTGYAVARPATGWLPPEHWLAHRLVRRLEALRTDAPDLRLGPDGKAAVLCAEPADGGRVGVESVTVSLQQQVGADELATRRAVIEVVRAALADAGDTFAVPADLPARVLVNGAGNFECGGPMGDNGLSGKKLVVDAYGPRVPIGGGALSGKDFFKVDRAGAIAARRLALAAVRHGGAREATVELLWRPGDRAARLAALVDEAGRALEPGPWAAAIDLSLLHSGRRYARGLDLLRLAQHGHFGGRQPWEED